MKQKILLLCTLFWCMLMSFGQTLDQSNTPTVTPFGGNVFNLTIEGVNGENPGQTFTAGTTNVLSRVAVQLTNAANDFVAGTFQLNVYAGTNVAAAPLNTTNFTISTAPPTNAYQEFEINLSPTLAITSGSVYTFTIRGIGSAKVGVCSVNINGYPGGHANIYSSELTGYDLWFKTYVGAIASNSAPTDITLSATSVNENVAANTTVGNLSSTDPDIGNTFTYSLVAGTGSADNASFNISGNSLRISSSPDFEVKNSYAIRLRTSDQGGLFFEKQYTITINNVNETPTDITLSLTSVNENVAANTTVGALGSTDPDAGNTFTYTLVAGTGSTDNASFNISGSNLRITNSPNFEAKSSYAIRLRTTDQGGLFFEKQFTITINNVNETPTDITLSSTSVNENVVANTTVGTLSSTDPDAGNTFTYTLVAGTGSTDNASFNISGTNLRITNSPDFETKNSYAIRLRTTDQGGLFFEKQYTITINDLVESTTAATHLNFDGVDDLVNCGATLNTVLDPLNTITVEAWVRPSTNTGLGVIIGNYANPTSGNMQFLMRRDNANYTFWISGNPGIFKNVSANNAVVLNTWQHVAGVWNGSDLKIYINGVLAGTTTGVTESSFVTTTNNLMIGNNQAASPERFTGSIDEVRIWSAPRTIEQVNGSKNCELAGTESGLIAYYKFNQGFDASNNVAVTTLTATTGPNGTLTNFALNGSVSNWLAGSPVTTGSIVPSVTTVTTPVFYAQGATASALTATVGANGTGLLWYTTATGG
ncbi:LamG-like jellyroll fold domain-containing protein, partial [Flavobacterium lacisediminis]